MGQYLHPERLKADPCASGADESWTHWHCTFVNFLGSVEHLEPNKLKVLFSYLKPSVFLRSEKLSWLWHRYITLNNHLEARDWRINIAVPPQTAISLGRPELSASTTTRSSRDLGSTPSRRSAKYLISSIYNRYPKQHDLFHAQAEFPSCGVFNTTPTFP